MGFAAECARLAVAALADGDAPPSHLDALRAAGARAGGPVVTP
jgi:hypothetical protein